MPERQAGAGGDTEPIDVAVIGGGCAGISAAFELTRPEHGGRYRVTVYQMGWRLGGKGASGRGPAARIEEHGLHLWMGFYENAFRLMRECYRELGRDPAECPIADWRDAFTPDPFVGVADRSHDGTWRPWTAHFPPGAGDPGDPLSERNPFTVRGYVVRAAALLRTLVGSVQQRRRDLAEDGGDEAEAAAAGVRELPERIAQVLRYGRLASMAGLLEAVALLKMALETVPGIPENTVLRLIRALGSGLHAQIEDLIREDDELRRLWEMIDVVLACLHGAIRFGLLTHPRGFDSINDYDWREWLALNGASQGSVDSAFMRGIYDLLFAYEGGDITRPRLAAGQALRGAVRMFFSYRGALFWKMRAGMGDVVFAPFYEVLKRRGVRFRFFHRLENLALCDPASLAPGERPYVQALEFAVQARTRDGAEYQPLVDVKGLPSWPAAPDFAQLVNGRKLRAAGRDFESDTAHEDERRLRLEVTRDFDFVVLAVGLGAVPRVCAELVERDQRWRDAVAHLGTVSTQAFQLWLRADRAGLGWRHPPINLSGFVTPFDTWADMSHLAPEEDWSEQPKSIAYFCSVLPEAVSPEAAAPAARAEEVRRNAVEFLQTQVHHLWPHAAAPGSFRWELLIDHAQQGDSTGAAGESRFGSQFWRANTNASDRYVLSLPGSLVYRISPLDNSYDNLTVAGDWTDCSHNAGCVEAAVMSGRLAAHALSRQPALEDIIGFDHP